MRYPPEMSADEIMEFEYELNRWLDQERGEGQYWAVNAECQIMADEQRDIYYDELERDHDEPYEPDYGDSWYEDQYHLEDL